MLQTRIKNALSTYLSFDPTPSQLRVIERLSHFLTDTDPTSLFLLKGYAGTGKTTLVSALVKTLDTYNIQTILLAPTGRAAKVLSAYTGRKANTIHRTIYYQRTLKDGRVILVPALNRNTRVLFIVDEASMIQDAANGDNGPFSSRNVLEDLHRFVYGGQQCRLMLIGDTAQLPPVGMDISPALDETGLRAAYNLKIFADEMTEVVRQAEDSGILRNATQLREKLRNADMRLPLLELHNQMDVESISGYELQEALMQSGMYTNSGESVVITRSNKRANLYNQQIRSRVLFREDDLAAGDLLMVVRNNYFCLEETSPAGFIANGDIIEVVRISERQERYGFHFVDISCCMIDYPEQPDFEVKILIDTLTADAPSLTPSDQQRLFENILEDYVDVGSRKTKLALLRQDPFYNALQVKYAYALTCHKTQGGQWPVVFIDQGYLTDKHIDKEYLRWLYTALTRSTRKVYLVGFGEALIS